MNPAVPVTTIFMACGTWSTLTSATSMAWAGGAGAVSTQMDPTVRSAAIRQRRPDALAILVFPSSLVTRTRIRPLGLVDDGGHAVPDLRPEPRGRADLGRSIEPREHALVGDPQAGRLTTAPADG